MKRLLSILLAAALLLSVLPAGLIGVSAETAEETYRGTAFTAGANTNISFGTADDYDYLSFDYKLTTEGTMAVIIRSPGDVPYYGSFTFNAAGEQGDYVGVTCEEMDDGYIHVEMDLDAVNITNSAYNRDNVPETISKLNVYGAWTSASGYIDNVQVSYAEGNEPVIRGEATTAGATKRFSFTLGDYDYVSFEYKLTTAGKICVRLPSSGDVPYYGIYDFTATGGSYDGVTCETMDDGYIKVTMKLDELQKTNNAANRDNVPASVKAVDIYAWSTADAYIDNVQAYNEEVIRGTATTAGATSRFSFALENYESVSFEYKLITDGKITVRVPSSGDVPYFGLYDFTAAGGSYDGVTCETLDDGYIKVTMKLDELTKTNNANNRDNVPEAIKGIDIYAWSTADAYIDNVSTVSRPIERGDALTAGTDWMVNAEAAAYEEISLDYWVTNDGQFALQLLDAEGANYYGNYYFNAAGETQDYAGVTCEKRSDRYMKITFKVAELAVNSGTAPAEIAAIKIVGSESTATGFVDYAQFKETAVPTGIRVGLLSDVHINANDTEQTIRFERALNALKLRGVDVVLISGDLQEHTGGVGAVDAIESYAASWLKVFPNNTNDLTGEHVEPVFIYGNHDKTLVTDQYWPESLGEYESSFIKEINGYYFVGAHYQQESEAARLIEYAKEDSNGYPFFYTQHCTLYDTLYGIKEENTGTAKTVLNNLADASNAITFTGHTHTPAANERSIWQSTDEADPDFTAVLVPSINYGYVKELGLGDATYPLSQNGMYMVVNGSDVTITRLSFADPADEDGLEIGENWSFDAADANDRPYDYDTRAAAVSKPEFAESAKITAEYLSQERVIFSFPAATVTAPEGFSDQIEHYYVELINTATGEVVNSYVMPTGFIFDDQPARFAGPYCVGFVGLSADTEYQIKVYAREFYQVSSEPLTLTFNTADGAAETNRGTATTAGATTTFSFTADDYDYVSFEYKPTTTGTVSTILRSPGDIPYYGAFKFDAAGETEDYAGITTEIMDDGYILVTMKLSELGITNGKYNRNNAPETVAKLDIYQWSTADAYVDNVKAFDEEVIRGTAVTAGTTKRFSFTLDDYDVVVFDYKLTTEGKICVRLPSSGDVPYYGIFDFTAAGGNYAGVTFENLEDGYIRVTLKLDEVMRTNNANNRDSVPQSIKAVDIYQWSTADSYIDNIHAYKGVVTPPTAFKEGYTTYTCSICGDSYVDDYVDAVGIGTLKFSSASLMLQHDLTINYFVDANLFVEDAYVNPYVTFVVGNATETVTEYTVRDGMYVFACRHLSPSQMGDTMTATLYGELDGQLYSYAMEYGVSKYCYSMLAQTEDAKLRTLLVDLLNYGAAAQTYTWYKDKTLCNANLTAEQLAWGTSAVPAVSSVTNTKYAVTENKKVSWKAASLVLQNSVTMRFRFGAQSIENLSVKISAAGSEWTLTQISAAAGLEGQYYVDFTGLTARQMRENVYVTVYEGDTAVSNTLLYSVESYAAAKQNDADADLVALLVAMIRYGDSAAAYLN